MADNMLDAIYQGMVARRQREAYDTIDQANEQIVAQNGRISDLCRQLEAAWRDATAKDREIARLKDALALHQMELAGRDAQADAMKAQHPDSPLMADSGQVYAAATHRGKAKTKLRLIYERAYDAMGRKIGISDPASRRLN